MSQACPINFTTVDNTASRIGSLLTSGIVGLFFVTGHPVWLYALGFDIMVRLYGNKQFSPLFQASRLLRGLLHLPIRKADGAAKSVAGHFGLLFVLLMIAASHLGLAILLQVIAAVYVFCLLLDTVSGFCVGCKVYYLYRLICGER